MAVFIDDYMADFKHGNIKMKMSHMVADTHEELIAMVDKIGVFPNHIQYPGTWKEHFDICNSKRILAIRRGAIPISSRELSEKLQVRRKALVDAARSRENS